MVWYEFVWFGHNYEAECWKWLCNPTPSLTHSAGNEGGHRAARAAKKERVNDSNNSSDES